MPQSSFAGVVCRWVKVVDDTLAEASADGLILAHPPLPCWWSATRRPEERRHASHHSPPA